MSGRFGWASENGVTCSFICTGNANQKCGGQNANYIYYLPLVSRKFRFKRKRRLYKPRKRCK